jgi:hypothetical protein
MLSFTKGNKKLRVHNGLWTFSLPAGHSCPGALDCLSKADPETGKVRDGRSTKFRCYATSEEAFKPSVRVSRWNNFKQVKRMLSQKDGVHKLADLINASLPKKARIIRIHASGDFFNYEYMKAWHIVAERNPDILFYGYTKSLDFWVRLEREYAGLAHNFVLTASVGGRHDWMIEARRLQKAVVVFSEEEAQSLGLPIDHDDTHAMRRQGDFALLIHGVQPAGTPAAKALAKLKSQGYNKNRRLALPMVG